MDDLDRYRRDLDKIDKGLLELLLQRQNIAKKIGNYKKKNKLRVVDKKREKIVFEKINSYCQEHGLNKNFCKSIFKKIIKNSRNVQK
ncbi:chorismate mutase [Candidatus Pacearchaeota archaeon]|nr:chorismate mutase [Candidatus Pacearchaeota archaeon]MBD3283370.1 chorismate mutase [Candidatus Pacearchaeota archaeon]